MWLEFRFEFGNNDNSQYEFGVVGRDDPIQIKESAAYYLRHLMQGEDWELDAADAVDDDRDTGSHLTRKFGVNLGRGGGAIRDDVDHCGQWKSRDRQLDTYIRLDDNPVRRRKGGKDSRRRRSGRVLRSRG